MKNNKVQGISFPDEELLVAAMRKARSLDRSLSNYVCGLIKSDLAEAGIGPGGELKETADGPSVKQGGTGPVSGQQSSYGHPVTKKKASSGLAHATAALVSRKKSS